MASKHAPPRIKMLPPSQNDTDDGNSEYEDVIAPNILRKKLDSMGETRAELQRRIKVLKTELYSAREKEQYALDKLAISVDVNRNKAETIARKDGEIATIRQTNEKQKTEIDNFQTKINELEQALQETRKEVEKHKALNRNSSLAPYIETMREESEKLREDVRMLKQTVDDLTKQMQCKDGMLMEEKEANQRERENLNIKLDTIMDAFRRNEEYRIKKEADDDIRYNKILRAVSDGRSNTANPVITQEQIHGHALPPISEDQYTGRNFLKIQGSSTGSVTDKPRRDGSLRETELPSQRRRVWSFSTKPKHTNPGYIKK